MIEISLTFLIILLCSGVWCLGVNTLLSPPYLFDYVGQKLDETLPSWVNKPIWRCPPCMGSIHGAFIYSIILAPEYGFIGLVPFCICLCGLNHILNRI